MAIDAGASALGLVSAMPSGPGVIADSEIAKIASAVPPAVATFLLTSLTRPEEIMAQHSYCGTSTIQLCDYLAPPVYEKLRQELRGIRLVQVIHVMSEQDVGFAETIAPYVDALLLDSGNPTLQVKQLGGTGRVHDWEYSRQIRERVSIPLFLAGGLRPANLRQAIQAVGPFGLDVCSGVRSNDRLDPEILRAFFDAIKPEPASPVDRK